MWRAFLTIVDCYKSYITPETHLWRFEVKFWRPIYSKYPLKNNILPIFLIFAFCANFGVCSGACDRSNALSNQQKLIPGVVYDLWEPTIVKKALHMTSYS